MSCALHAAAMQQEGVWLEQTGRLVRLISSPGCPVRPLEVVSVQIPHNRRSHCVCCLAHTRTACQTLLLPLQALHWPLCQGASLQRYCCCCYCTWCYRFDASLLRQGCLIKGRAVAAIAAVSKACMLHYAACLLAHLRWCTAVCLAVGSADNQVHVTLCHVVASHFGSPASLDGHIIESVRSGVYVHIE